MFHRFYVKYKNVLLRPLAHEDIESLRSWRNNAYATRFLRPIGFIDSNMQENWFKNYLKKNNEVIFAIVETQELNRLVGSVSIYNISDHLAEFGRIQVGDEQAHGKGIGKAATVLSLAFGFQTLHLEEIVACVHQNNIAAYNIYMQVGFKIIGRRASEVGGEEVLIKIDREKLVDRNRYISEIEFGEIS